VNGKRVVRLVSVTVLVATAVLSTVSGVAAIHLVDPTRAARSSWDRFSEISWAQEASFAPYDLGSEASSWDRFAEYLQAQEQAETARSLAYGTGSGASRALAVMSPVETVALDNASVTRFGLMVETQDRMELERSDTFGAATAGFAMDSLTRFEIYTWASGAIE